ncbi:MAG: TonB-dependent receptor [Prevotellaceae bacterium]|nr:TonB-dependent receptor [Prevotellaceae bacterium]
MFVIILMYFVCISATAQRITAEFHKLSMSEALLAVERQSNKCNINFIYEDLKDFTVTQRINNRPIAEALRMIAGFYPIRITQNGNVFSIECIQKETYKIMGRILDENDKPLSCATIELLNPQDSTLINSGVSNNNGDVVIPCGKKNVIAKISYIGYKTKYKLCTNCMIGNIRMEGSIIALNGIKVKGQKPIVKAEKGILTYNIPLLLQEMPSENAYEALTRIPGIMDGINGLSFAGNHATLIINGKQTTMSEQQIIDRLKSMPAEMVGSVEVMPSAPSQYHTHGLAINVITTDYVGTNQLSGQIKGMADQSKYVTGKGETNLIYSHNCFMLDAQYAYTDGKTYGEAEHVAEHPHITGRKHYEDVTQNTTDIRKHELRIGTDYAFAEKHRLSVAYTGTWQENKVVNVTTGTAPTIQDGKVSYHIHNVDVNYQLPFGLKMNASYMSYKNPRAQILGNNMQDLAYTLSTNSNQSINKWLLTADQEHSLKENWSVSYGIKAQITNNISYQKMYDDMGMEVPDGSSRVNYQERIISPYAGISKVFHKHLSIDASVSAEQYHTPKWNEWRIYPSLRATWNINKDHLMNLSFNSDAVYPSYWSTMSSVYYSSAYTEIWGNPDLKPYSHYKVDVMWQYKQRYSLMLFAQFNPGYSVQLAYQPKDTMSVVFQEKNFDFSNTYGVQASVMFSAGKWLTGNATLTGLYSRNKSTDFFDLPFDRKCFTAIMGTTLSAKLLQSHELRLIINPSFQTKAIQGVFDIAPLFMLGAQIYWLSDNKRWSLVLAGNNLTNCFFDVKSVYGNQNFSMRTNNDYRSVSLTAALKFGSYKDKKHREIDISRMGY